MPNSSGGFIDGCPLRVDDLYGYVSPFRSVAELPSLNERVQDGALASLDVSLKLLKADPVAVRHARGKFQDLDSIFAMVLKSESNLLTTSCRGASSKFNSRWPTYLP